MDERLTEGLKDIVNKEEVFLRIYDISNGLAKQLSLQLIGIEIDGVWHTSIEIFGQEYFFQGGVMWQMAGTTPFGQYKERISLGYTDCSRNAFEEFIEASRTTWTSDKYDLLENNCNNFSDFVAMFLVGKNIPAYILELPNKVRSNPNFNKIFKI